jgi:hypothetical protein
MTDNPDIERLQADLRRAILERDQARWMASNLKAQLKAMRQDLRQTRAELRQSALNMGRSGKEELRYENPDPHSEK